MPIAVKDVIGTKGIPTTAGSKILESYVPVYDATVVERCKAHGLRMLGKTNTDEFAMGSSTENSAYGPSHNPWDPTRVPGGSGGGSRGGGRRAGSRRGRSARTPAARSSSRRRSAATSACARRTAPSRATASSRSPRRSTRSGPVAKNVRDCAYLYSIISGRDENDTTTVDVPAVELPTGEDLKGLRIGVPKEMNEARGDRAGRRATRCARRSSSPSRSARRWGSARCRGRSTYGVACYYLVAPAEASSNLARYDGVRYGLRADGDDFREMVMRTRDAGFGDEPKRRIMIGTYALSSGYYDAYYGKAQKVRTRDQARARRGLRAVRRDRLADQPDGRVRARREGRRPDRDVPQRPARRSPRAWRGCPG